MCTYLDKNTNANNKQKKEENSVYILTESHSYKDIISDTHTHTLFKTFPPPYQTNTNKSLQLILMIFCPKFLESRPLNELRFPIIGGQLCFA